MNKENWDKLEESITEIKLTLVRNTVTLEEHMRRTAAAEKNIELTQERISAVQEKLEGDMEPIRDHVKTVNLIMRLLGIVTSTIAATLLFVKEFGLLNLFK